MTMRYVSSLSLGEHEGRTPTISLRATPPTLACDERLKKGRQKRDTTTSLGSHNQLEALAGGVKENFSVVGHCHDHGGAYDTRRSQRLQYQEHKTLDLPSPQGSYGTLLLVLLSTLQHKMGYRLIQKGNPFDPTQEQTLDQNQIAISYRQSLILRTRLIILTQRTCCQMQVSRA